MTKPKILITRPWPAGAQAYMQSRYDVTVNDAAPLTPAQLAEAMTQYDALCPTVTDKLTPEVFATPNTRVRMIGNFGAGYEHINIDAAKSAGIVVSNTPDVLTEATADIALMLMLMTSRRASEAERQLRSGGWKGWGTTALMGQSLQGKTLGLVGFGRIAQATAHKARTALGMEIAYYSRRQAAPDIEAAHGARYVASLDELAAQADVLSLHTPGGPETHHMVNHRLLSLMKRSAILINTARGSVVKEDDLAEALAAGTIWAAGLDVYEREPIVHDALLPLDNAVLLPHLGSATVETREAMGMRAARNVDQFFAGEAVGDRVA
ncbi:2-hydroxyacid dehydrogenase [Asticcacaulis sp. AC460]|uniref:2-hydroxyacid dehydrogenase n=1 Tax=Asticcacaulis sp. AC460 TaxID=1282360 RepID=UPI0003C40307|nr:D-glycerate dehydrogenase [Asticcacaulis sp. AC460]ESQ88338.1 2-hydroxyacid dehydrogenase [Asticcacaulis sp. AC460]